MKLIGKSMRLLPRLYLVCVRELDPPGRPGGSTMHYRLRWHRHRILAEANGTAAVIDRINNRT